MTDEVLRDRERPGDDGTHRSECILASASQVLTGLPVGLPNCSVICGRCGAQLEEGRAVTVYGYRVAARDEWDLRRCYCEDCAPAGLPVPTLGVAELIARAWLGTLTIPRTRTYRLCLTDVECITYSPPGEGSPA